jgi:hypothetical protein
VCVEVCVVVSVLLWWSVWMCDTMVCVCGVGWSVGGNPSAMLFCF